MNRIATAALSTLPRAEVIRASAGSGKTYVLVQRYIALLFRGTSPRSILASTFTVRAAGEILTRVLARLARCIESAAERETLAHEIGVPNSLVADQINVVFIRTLRELPLAAVCTLDGLVARIAGGLPLACELPPGWQLSELAEMPRELERLIVAAFSRELGAMLSLVANKDAGRAVAAPLIQLCERFHQELQLYGPGAFNLDPLLAEQRLLAPQGAALYGQAAALAEQIKALEAPKTKKGEPNKTIVRLISEIPEQLNNHSFSDLFKKEFIQRFWRAEQSKSGEVEYSRVVLSRENFNPLFSAARFVAGVEFGRLCDRSRVLLAVLAQFDALYRAEIQRSGQVRHHDLLLGVARFMASDTLSDVAFAINQRFSHILLDEFQDTSPLQWSVLKPLVEEILRDETTDRSAMIVGDQKQAIYGWRGGEAAIFDAALKIGGETGEHWRERNLLVSYRSSSTVLSFVNAIFAALTTQVDGIEPKALSEGLRQFTSLFGVHEAHRTNLSGTVSVTTEADSTESSDEFDAEIARDAWVLAKLREVQARNPKGSIGILTRKNETVVQLVSLLRAHGFSVSGDGRAGAMRTRVVEGVRMALYVALHPADSVSRFGAIACGVATSEADLDTLLHDPSWRRLLARMVALSRSQELTEQERADLSAAAMLVSEGIERGRDARELRSMLALQPMAANVATISVLTMHRSKGLEFDSVLLPELNSKLIRSMVPDLLQWRRADNAPMVMPFVNEDLRSLHPEFERADHEMQCGEYYEAFCLMYVALTRAVHELHVWGKSPKLTAADDEGAKQIKPTTMFGLILRALNVPHELLARGGEVYRNES